MQAQAIPAPQTSVVSSKTSPAAEDLKRQELILEELKKLREDVSGLQAQVTSLNELVDLYKKLDANQKDQINTLKEALSTRDRIEEIYKEKDKIRTDQIVTLQQEVNVLKEQVEKLQKRNKRNVILSILTGVALGLAAVL